jgi:tetratricopeptide (TPR) repeat protein
VLTRALAKQPLDRYGSCGAFVAAARAAAAERHVDRRRLALSVAMLILAALAGAAIALGVDSFTSSGGTTTVTTAARPPLARPGFSLKKLLLLDDGRTLNDIAYVLIGAHRYREALPFARKAVKNAHTNPTRAYATFNLGYVLLQLGDCAESLPLLRQALPLEPQDQRQYVRNRIQQAQRRCSRGGASAQAQSQ